MTSKGGFVMAALDGVRRSVGGCDVYVVGAHGLPRAVLLFLLWEVCARVSEVMMYM